MYSCAYTKEFNKLKWTMDEETNKPANSTYHTLIQSLISHDCLSRPEEEAREKAKEKGRKAVEHL